MPRRLASVIQRALRPAARGGAFLIVVLLVTVGLAGPAAAHASLLASDPADGAVVGSAPKVIRLDFSEPVQLDLSRFELQRPDGSRIQLGAPRAGMGKANQVEIPVPDLQRGSYVITWHAATRDTHIATGQILFGLGAAIPKGLKSGSASSQVLAWTAGAARFAWYLALALAAGALFALTWAAGPGRGGAPGSRRSEVVADFREAARRACRAAGAALVGVGALRLTLLAVQAAVNAGGGRSVAGAVEAALTAYQGRVWMGAVLASAAVLVLLRLLPRRGPVGRGRLLPLGAGLLLLCGLEVATGHAATRRAPLEGIVVTALHLASVAVWVGTLAAFLVIAGRPAYRRHAATDRAGLRRDFLRGFSPVATGALAVIVASGLWLAGVSLGPVGKLATTAYGRTIALKACLLALAAGLGLYHRQSFGSRAARAEVRPRSGAEPGPRGRLAGRTVPAEVAVLVATVAAAAALTGLQPAGQLIALRQAQAKAQLVVARPIDCERTPAFLVGCWQRYFDATTRKKGADAALTDLDALSRTGAYAQGQCHQIAHVIGRVAATRYPSLATGLAAGQRMGNICFSGYFHGLLEAYTSSLTDTQLRQRLDHMCDQPGVKRYSFDNYTCVHGLGHGITLRYQNDVFKALPWCDSMADPWDQQSCYTGVFMQNIIADQVEGTAVDIRPSDPVYPCNAVTDKQKPSCYIMVTSNILKQDNWDYHAGFVACDRVERPYDVTCYESMGRDISSREVMDGPKTIEACQLATKDVAFRSCITAAAKNDISTDHNGDRAAALCQITPVGAQADCFKARADYLKQF